jgi:hypothetical protein
MDSCLLYFICDMFHGTSVNLAVSLASKYFYTARAARDLVRSADYWECRVNAFYGVTIGILSCLSCLI